MKIFTRNLPFFLLITLFCFTDQLFSQNHETSIGRAPATQNPVKEVTKNDNLTTTIAYGSDGIGNLWFSAAIPAGTLTQIGPNGGFLHMGGDFDGQGVFYAINGNLNSLITVNYLTGAETVVGVITGVTAGLTVTSISWNPADSKMYLSASNLTTSFLYTINLTTAAATLVGEITNAPCIIAIGINCTGEIYGVDIVTDSLVSINPGTGAGTVLGALNFDANYAQDVDFDFATNTLYLAAYNNTAMSGELRTANLTNGSTALVLGWPGVELTSFGIQGSCGPVPVELNRFEAVPKDGQVELQWATSTETNNKGFSIERKSADGFIEVGFVQGAGTTAEIKQYSFTDRNIPAGTQIYRLRQIDLDGTVALSSEVTVEIGAPTTFSLDQNYPNPFNPSTTFDFKIATGGKVMLSVYDLLGRELEVLVDEMMTPGSYSVKFDATGYSSGIYLYRLESSGFVQTRKLIIMK
ncbi:MAG: T9SS type A sorting domain-containing protein [Bacteroidetes bacterium]|nr:T9SS type A sorting domain-containing protein [Bacteroidota bacterium]